MFVFERLINKTKNIFPLTIINLYFSMSSSMIIISIMICVIVSHFILKNSHIKFQNLLVMVV